LKNKKVKIIAEAGVNHNGSIKMAEKLIDVAKDSGADYVKFQTYKTELLLTKDAEKANYQKLSTGDNQSQYDMLKKLELSPKDHRHLIDYCNEKKIKFLSSPFDIESIELLSNLHLSTFKIPSSEITNLPYLRHISSKKKKLILSTGMSTLNEVGSALKILYSSGLKKKHITVLHCNTEYPSPFPDINLRAMLTLKESFGVKVGYSDHTKGIEIPTAATALGATVIEKHFTLDRNLEGPDHRASLEPRELKSMVKAIRNVEMALGSKRKHPSISEKKNIAIARKSIAAKENILKGETFTVRNITTKRPGTGISPMYWDLILNEKSKKTFRPDELITHKFKKQQ
tara:strand:- start:448 stop:1476 length:1029 start_codon:yes stop_codon:yes gene_type:complete